jgi:hypothetical protein
VNENKEIARLIRQSMRDDIIAGCLTVVSMLLNLWVLIG